METNDFNESRWLFGKDDGKNCQILAKTWCSHNQANTDSLSKNEAWKLKFGVVVPYGIYMVWILDFFKKLADCVQNFGQFAKLKDGNYQIFTFLPIKSSRSKTENYGQERPKFDLIWPSSRLLVGSEKCQFFDILDKF